MKTSLAKLKKKAGFTLVEALIVLAILGVLAAVAIPAYTVQLENSRIKVDDSAVSAAASMAVSDYLLNNYTGAKTYNVYGTVVDGSVTMKIRTTDTADDTNYPGLAVNDAKLAPQSKHYNPTGGAMQIVITVVDGALTSAKWA